MLRRKRRNRDEIQARHAAQSAGIRKRLGETLEGVSGNDMKAAALLIAFSQLRDSLNQVFNNTDTSALFRETIRSRYPETLPMLQQYQKERNESTVWLSRHPLMMTCMAERLPPQLRVACTNGRMREARG